MSFTLSRRKNKIIVTVGPSLNEKEHIRKAIQAGVNIFRLNFSHSDHAFYKKTIANIREISAELMAPCGILQDLQGPKIRVGKVKDGQMTLEDGQMVSVSSDYKISQGNEIRADLDVIAGVCKPGNLIFLDDGLLELEVKSVEGSKMHCEVKHGGILKDRKGMNCPGMYLPVDCLTPKDLEDLQFGLDQQVDFIALSFVRHASDVVRLKQMIKKHDKGSHAQVISKIECLEAIDFLEEIVEVSDAVMVARGDMAVEVGQASMPVYQKRIINLCNIAHTPVITATQMLDSMAENPRPTRAEITDVANAILDGSDTLMLSRESSTGKYPFKCIHTMHAIAQKIQNNTEDIYDYLSLESDKLENHQSVGAAACLMALKMDVKLIACLSTTGVTAIHIAGFRPRVPIIAITNRSQTLSRLTLSWGVNSLLIGEYDNFLEMTDHLENVLLSNDLVEKGDDIILTLGLPVHRKGTTNGVQIYKITKSKDEVPKEMIEKKSYRFFNEAKC